jgi:hypothetical protein
MASEYRNDSRVIAASFVAVYVRDVLTAEDRANAVENLAAIMERVYYHGYHRGQLAFTSELIKQIGSRPEIPAAELTAIASALVAAP